MKKNLRKKEGEQKGITLISLIVTIIVLLILAGVTLNMVMGENGIIAKATTAKEKTAEAQDKEMAELAKYESEINKVVGNREYSLINYSTSEQDTGLKWIDGKKIYQKTINYGALPNNTIKNVNHGINNMEALVNVYGYAFEETRNIWYEIPRVGYGTYDIPMTIWSDRIELSTKTDSFSGFSVCYITLQYTKTADTATND